MSQSPTSSRVRWRVLLMLMALCFISHFNRASLASAGDERLMKQFSITPEAMGWLYSVSHRLYPLHGAGRVVHRPLRAAGGAHADGYGAPQKLDRWFRG